METAPSAGLEMYNHETDRRALLALFNATGGAGWKNKNGWEDNSNDLSVWYGVSVKSGRVSAVIMGGNRLNGSLPREIWDLTELEQLDFGDNHLQGDLPPIPENRMLKLYLFNLGTNKLTGNLPDLHLLPSLEETFLDKNRFTGSLSENIGRCEKLRMIFLFSNKLEGNLPASLGKLVLLKKLDISDNGFSGVIPEECVHMAELREFKVDFITDLKKPGNARVKSAFNNWVNDRKLGKDLARLPFASSSVEIAGDEGKAKAFPGKDDQGMLFEGPLKSRDHDCLGFEDYADVLANRLQDQAAWPVGLGIYAQWGAGKSSLCEMIIRKLETPPGESMQDPWLIRWLWRTTGGAALYALAAGLVTAVSGICRPLASVTETDETDEDKRKGGARHPTFGRCCNSSKGGVDVNSMERGVEASAVSSPPSPTVKTIVASFNAWLFADSKVLWAILVSKIFEEVEEHFGKGAVRATRVRHAVSSATCMDWCTVVSNSIIVICIAAAAVWVAEQIGDLEEQAERVAAGVALAGVPILIVLVVVKALPVVFKSQGEVILRKAETIGESVGAAHLGFMAEVQEEIQVLLGMLKTKSTKDEKYLLVVSIDNLDRCPHRQIIRVLEAVHLLLEHNEVNVAVILALDPRLIIAAIEKDMGDRMCQEVSGSEYLDKIIHWPFCIPGGTKEERTSLLHNWLQNQELRRRPSDPMVSVQDGIGTNATEGSACVDMRPQSTNGQRGRPSIAPGDEGDAKVDGESPHAVRESHCPPERQGSSTASSGGGDDLDNAAKDLRDASHYSAVVAPVSEHGSNNDTPSPTTAGARTPLPLIREVSYGAQTSAEVTELERMITNAATTPRKAKRVCNIYSIQRELAIKRAKKMRHDFTHDDALKLLRWTVPSEFWPFHTACLAAIIPREETDLDQRRHTTTLQALFNDKGEAFLSRIFGGKGSSRNAADMAGNGSRILDFDSSSRITARRLIGMDEEYEGFSHLLDSRPKLTVADFEEDRLGLLRLSINLNPAMVARVTTWSRSKYEFNGN